MVKPQMATSVPHSHLLTASFPPGEKGRRIREKTKGKTMRAEIKPVYLKGNKLKHSNTNGNINSNNDFNTEERKENPKKKH